MSDTLQRDPAVARDIVVALQDAKCAARDVATFDWRAAARRIARMCEDARYGTQSDALLAAHTDAEFRTVCAEAALAIWADTDTL